MTQILATIHGQSGGGTSLPDLLCMDCAQTLRLTAVGMTLTNTAGHRTVVGASGLIASRVEELQSDVGEGPSVDASLASRSVIHDDLMIDSGARWPIFAPAAVAAGIRGVSALPLRVGGVRLGSLGLYRSSPGHLDDAQSDTAETYAAAAVAVLVGLQGEATETALHPDLAAPMAYRAVIHQATGFLSVKASLEMSEALLLLRANAFAADRPLVDVAHDVLSGQLRLHPEEKEDD
ncbi:GAF and ANTAR domain-containing protein [Nocardioides sp. Root190]|uniref:GAF and ANTAR domain-containing protein n=1 Tax=Nocardioides sp. Root190 TaxID=1736488 RepID=UPI0012FA3691|nr:GAF and ANTAR domain-containing protein [Nocardioides sp. Root190]